MSSVKKNIFNKSAFVFGIVLCCVMLSSCTEPAPPSTLNKGQVNSEIVTTLNDMAIQNAIISQHTLFPYHFVANSKKLNELGKRDLGVLMNHFRENPGQLNIRRNNSSEELYNSRVSFVLGTLEAAGIKKDRITVSDGLAGGPGMSSQKVVSILEDDRTKSAGDKTNKTRSKQR